MTKHHTITSPAFLLSLQTPDGNDWKQQESLIADFVKRYCNKPSDLKMGRVKLRAETSPYLALALVIRSLGDYLKINFDDLNAYRGKAKDIMSQPTHTRRRDILIRAFKQAGWELHYGDNITRDGALMGACQDIKYLA